MYRKKVRGCILKYVQVGSPLGSSFLFLVKKILVFIQTKLAMRVSHFGSLMMGQLE